MDARKRIAILGGGMSGLTSIKACLEESFEPVCYEGSDDIGGLWRYRDQDVDGRSSVMKSTIINTSKEVSAFSDFPPPKEYPNYMHNRQMCRYFELYADNFGLRKYIKLSHKVIKVVHSFDYERTGRWVVSFTFTDSEGVQVTSNETFDGVMVCTGHHVTPHIPDFEGMQNFKGRIIHTHSYKVPDEFKDQNVMVVGTGNSGSDVAVELSNVAQQVYLSTRRGFWIVNRVGPQGYPIDMTFSTRAKNLLVPKWLRARTLEKNATNLLDYNLYGIRAAHSILAQHPTVSDSLPNRIICGTVKVKGPIKRFVPEGVVFVGEEYNPTIALDAVVMATGYDAGFSIIDRSIARIDNNSCELFLYVFPPRQKHPTLSFVGNAQPIGPLFPISELQARWIVKVLKGDCKLPTEKLMLEDIARRAKYNAENYISGTRHVTEVIGIAYCDQLAIKIGARPNLFAMAITDPRLFRKVFFGANIPYQFRLNGPHSWSGARNAIMTYESRVKAAFDTNSCAMKRKQEYNSIVLTGSVVLSGIILASAILINCSLINNRPAIWFK